jgi:hypothetical protein
VHWAMTIRTDRRLRPANRSLRRLHLGWYVFAPSSDGLDAADRISQKRKRDGPAVFDADASESTPCLIHPPSPAVACLQLRLTGLLRKRGDWRIIGI